MNYFLGLDLGSSGCRGVVIDQAGRIQAMAREAWPPPHRQGAASEQAPELWWQAVLEVLRSLARQTAPHVPEAVAVDGTSASLLVCDADGVPAGPALMYDDARAQSESARIRACAPAYSAATSVTASLAKLLFLQAHVPDFHYALHQAEWISGRLCANFGHGDENNCLKLGYDPIRRVWPEWLQELDIDPACLPRVHPPGTPVARMSSELAAHLGWHQEPWIVAGTTDSTAAFLASGAQEIGDAVTSLGSTLVVKILSPLPVTAPEFGVYSHRLGDRWLAGGASNSGGAVLLEYFEPAQLEQLSQTIFPLRPSGFDYYPLIRPGERFPVNDPDFLPKLTPRPASDALFLHGLLEGIARIEQAGYAKLWELGAPAVERIYTSGGGARNSTWQTLRQNLLDVPVLRAQQEEAAYGSALLAKKSFS